MIDLKRLILAAVMLWPVCRANAETLWVGNAQVVAATPQCQGTVAAGDFYRAVYRPMGTSIGNGANSHLALFSQRSSFAMRVPNKTFQDGVNYVGQTVNSSISVTSRAGGILNWQESEAFGGPLRSNVVASIANFFGTTGCTGTVSMGLVRLP
jgi:hypothetical protein